MGLLPKKKNKSVDTTFLHSHDEIPPEYVAFLQWNYLELLTENNLLIHTLKEQEPVNHFVFICFLFRLFVCLFSFL